GAGFLRAIGVLITPAFLLLGAALLGAATRPETFAALRVGTTLRAVLPAALAEALPFGFATFVFKAF
ncbi:MAG TPA: hypothetical protein VFA77_00940, partial [Candidatus Eisenbacteria bacterium]|nr:hypothetical protein [Candidatus Eisenbacteria bacterium]